MPHRLGVSKQRAERLCGPYVTGKVGAGGALAITLLMDMVDFVSMAITGLRPLDSSMSIAQSNGAGVQFVGSSSIGCPSV